MHTPLFLQASKDGDQENAAANRGKILVLRRRIEELESQITQKNEELQKKVVFYNVTFHLCGVGFFEYVYLNTCLILCS